MSRAGCRDQASGSPNLNGCLCAGEQQQAAGAKYVDVLASELNRKQHLYNDDLAFIREVKQGVVPAPGMNPDQELKTLRLRFDAFKKDFKVSCCWTLQVCYCMQEQVSMVRQHWQWSYHQKNASLSGESLHRGMHWTQNCPNTLLGHWNCRRDWQTQRTY